MFRTKGFVYLRRLSRKIGVVPVTARKTAALPSRCSLRLHTLSATERTFLKAATITHRTCKGTKYSGSFARETYYTIVT
jgi:hypothetical protein